MFFPFTEVKYFNVSEKALQRQQNSQKKNQQTMELNAILSKWVHNNILLTKFILSFITNQQLTLHRDLLIRRFNYFLFASFLFSLRLVEIAKLMKNAVWTDLIRKNSLRKFKSGLGSTGFSTCLIYILMQTGQYQRKM